MFVGGKLANPGCLLSAWAGERREVGELRAFSCRSKWVSARAENKKRRRPRRAILSPAGAIRRSTRSCRPPEPAIFKGKVGPKRTNRSRLPDWSADGRSQPTGAPNVRTSCVDDVGLRRSRVCIMARPFAKDGRTWNRLAQGAGVRFLSGQNSTRNRRLCTARRRSAFLTGLATNHSPMRLACITERFDGIPARMAHPLAKLAYLVRMD